MKESTNNAIRSPRAPPHQFRRDGGLDRLVHYIVAPLPWASPCINVWGCLSIITSFLTFVTAREGFQRHSLGLSCLVAGGGGAAKWAATTMILNYLIK